MAMIYPAMARKDRVVPLVSRSGIVGRNRTPSNLRGNYNDTSIIKVTIPPPSGNMNIDIGISGNNLLNTLGVFDLRLGGVILPAAPQWSYVSAVLFSKAKFISSVKFGYDGTNWCVLIKPNQNLNQSMISLDRVLCDLVNYSENVTLSLITDESGITNIVETPVVWNGYDGVWYTPTLAPGAAGTLQYRKAGNIVFTKGRVAPNSTGALKIASLAAGFRPGETQMTLLIPSNGDKNNIRYLIINSSGDITLGESAGAALEYMIDTSFIAEN